MNWRLPTQTQTKPSSFIPVLRGLIQRKCASCGQHTIAGGECSECSQKQQLLQRRTTNHPESSEIPPIVHEVLQTPGHTLDSDTRASMESRFGYDFSQVQVHTGAKSAESALAINALAYTVGKDIVFGAGQYAPNTIFGGELIAHELTHVIQQNGNFWHNSQSLTLDNSSNSAEHEANRIAHSITENGATQAVQQNTIMQIQRQPTGNRPLPYHEATEMLTCIRIMGEDNAAYCRQQVLGQSPPVTLPPRPLTAQEIGNLLLQAITSGRLQVQPRELRHFQQLATTGQVVVDGNTIRPSPELLRLLENLLNRTLANPAQATADFGILSVFRFASGPHGEVTSPNRAIGRAIDISRYAGHEIDMANPDEALAGVLAVIRDLPGGCFTLGLPRPRNPALRNPFLPVNTPTDIEHSPTGTLRGDLSRIQDVDGRRQLTDAINAAQAQEGVVIQFLFPDARDHLHVKAVPCRI